MDSSWLPLLPLLFLFAVLFLLPRRQGTAAPSRPARAAGLLAVALVYTVGLVTYMLLATQPIQPPLADPVMVAPVEP